METDEIQAELLGNIDKLSPLVARQAILLSRPEAKRLTIIRYDLVKLVAKYKAGQTIIKKEYQILPVALDYPRKQTAQLVKQLETLLGWYGRGHPAFRWLQAHGIAPWHCGALISLMDIRRFKDTESLFRFLHLGYNKYKVVEAHTRPKVWRKMLESIRQIVAQGKMPFYRQIKLRRMEELKNMLVENKHGYLVKHARPQALSPSFILHLDGKCKRELCYWKQLLETDDLPPHLPWASCNALAIRQMRQIFFSHLAQVMLVGEKGIRWQKDKANWIDVPFTDLVKGWDTARIVRGNGFSTEGGRRPVQNLEPLEWLDG